MLEMVWEPKLLTLIVSLKMYVRVNLGCFIPR